MTTHDRALDLAAAAFDFRLTAAERIDLDRHLAACGQCRLELDGMADDARRLGSRPPRRMPPGAAAAVRASLERPRRQLRLAMALAAAALLILAGLAAASVGASLLRLLDMNRLAIEPQPSAAASPAAPSGEPGSWSLTAGGVSNLPFAVVSVVPTADGWLAIGGRACARAGDWAFDCRVPIAISSDGRTWTLADASIPLTARYVPPSSGPEAGVVAAAGGPDGFVAVGFDPISDRAGVRGVAWWSSDGGTWERIQLEDGARPAAVFRAPDRWLIGGVLYRGVTLGTDRPIGAVWTSTDGRTWTRIVDDAVFDVGGYVDTMEDPGSGGIEAFAASGTTLVAGGSVCTDGGLPCTVSAWVSTDGLAWERAGALPSGDGLEALAEVHGAFIAAARHCEAGAECATVLLRSVDGRAWEALPGTLAPFAGLGVSDGGAVLVTGGYDAFEVRASADGDAWTLVGSIVRPDRANWEAGALVPRGAEGLDLLIRIDPVDPVESEADASTMVWAITPAR